VNSLSPIATVEKNVWMCLSQALGVSTFTIHGTPNLSVRLPKDELQKVFIKGIVTFPPSLTQ